LLGVTVYGEVDYIAYYEPEIHGRRPNFVVIGTDLGLVVLDTHSVLFA
jgi:hypothetical protein